MQLNRRKKICYPVFATFPNYQTKNKPSKKLAINWQLWLGGIFSILLLGGTVYFFIFSPFFQIGNIEISGNEIITQEKIQAQVRPFLEGKLLKFIPRNSLVIFPAKKVEKKIFDEFSEVETIKINKNFPRTLALKIKERQTAGIWCQSEPALTEESTSLDNQASTSSAVKKNPSAGTSAMSSVPNGSGQVPLANQCFFIDEGGVIYREAPEISGTIMPTFYGATTGKIELRSQIIASSTLSFASQIKKKLREIPVDIIGFLTQAKNSPELTALTSQGWSIYFDSQRVALTQFRIIQTLLKDEIKNNQANLEYIDLRIPNRVYYK